MVCARREEKKEFIERENNERSFLACAQLVSVLVNWGCKLFAEDVCMMRKMKLILWAYEFNYGVV